MPDGDCPKEYPALLDAAYVKARDLELRVRYGFGARCVAMHLDDAKILNVATLFGVEVYVDAELAPGHRRSPRLRRRYEAR